MARAAPRAGAVREPAREGDVALGGRLSSPTRAGPHSPSVRWCRSPCDEVTILGTVGLTRTESGDAMALHEIVSGTGSSTGLCKVTEVPGLGAFCQTLDGAKAPPSVSHEQLTGTRDLPDQDGRADSDLLHPR